MNFLLNYFALLLTALLTLMASQPVTASMAEHQAVLDLVPLTAVDRTVVNDGPWSDPITWSGGKLPQAGENILVPVDKTLIADIESNLGFKTIRVDGNLKFATNKNVQIKMDTLVVTPSGTFEIGAEDARVPVSNTVKIIVADNGPIDRIWDPSNISRGVILQGKTRIFGTEKSAYHQLAVNPALNAAQIKLTRVPTGWSVGDTIVVTATQFRKKNKNDLSYQTQDEEKVIKDIDGQTVSLGKIGIGGLVADPLNYSHVPPDENMPVFVANLTRNVQFIGEGGNAVPPSQRGHFMVMHNPDAIIKGAGFYFLGRTDKSIPINDFKLKSNGSRLTDSKGQYIPDVNTNPRGRYPVHFHHTGNTVKSAPAICSGNAVISSAGWGFVNHTSYVIMENNASYDVYGSHFVSEDGNEIGSFKHNIAIKSEGRAKTIIKSGTGNHDLGHTGHGFWLESRNLAVEDNVVSGVYDAGLVYFHRISVNGINKSISMPNLLTPYKNITKNLSTITFSRIPIVDQKNMTILSSGAALVVVKSSRDQGHDVRSVIDSLKAYSVMDGMNLEYTERYTFKNLEIVADPTSDWWRYGVQLMPNSRDFAFANSRIDGFVHPIVTNTEFMHSPDNTDIVFSDVSIDGRPINPATDIHTEAKDVTSNYDPKLHKVVVANPGVLKFTPSSNMSFDLPINLRDHVVVTGVKTDSAGTIAYESTWYYASLRNVLKKGYYTRPDGSKCIFIKDYIADRLTGEVKELNTRLTLQADNFNLGPKLGSLTY